MHFFLHSVYLWYYTKINVLLRHPVFNVYSLLQVVQSIFMRCQKSQTENHFISSKRLRVAVGRVLSGIGTAVQQVGCCQELGQQCSGQGASRNWDSSAVGRVRPGIGKINFVILFLLTDMKIIHTGSCRTMFFFFNCSFPEDCNLLTQ